MSKSCECYRVFSCPVHGGVDIDILSEDLKNHTAKVRCSCCGFEGEIESRCLVHSMGDKDCLTSKEYMEARIIDQLRSFRENNVVLRDITFDDLTKSGLLPNELLAYLHAKWVGETPDRESSVRIGTLYLTVQNGRLSIRFEARFNVLDEEKKSLFDCVDFHGTVEGDRGENL